MLIVATVFVLGVAADLFITALALGSLDGFGEGNPVLARWFASYGVSATSIAVVSVSFVVAVAAVEVVRVADSRLVKRWTTAALGVLGALRWSVVAANVWLIASH